MRTCATSKGCHRRRASCAARCPLKCRCSRTGLAYRVDVVAGQKTGFFLDQRDSRATVRALAAGRATLNVFCYTGSFTLAALAGGAARVVSIDSSADALALARENLARNLLALKLLRPGGLLATICSSVKRLLRIGSSLAKEPFFQKPMVRKTSSGQEDYNHRRPHGSLGHLTPSEYARSGQKSRQCSGGIVLQN